MIKRRLGLTAAALLALAMLAMPAVADGHVEPHDHMITTPGNERSIQVGPDVCSFDDPDTAPNYGGHVNFHNHVHQGEPDHIARGSADGCENPRY